MLSITTSQPLILFCILLVSRMTAQQIHLACQFSCYEKSSKVISFRLRNKKGTLKMAHMKKHNFMDGIFPELNCRLKWVTFPFCEKTTLSYIYLLFENKPNTLTHPSL